MTTTNDRERIVPDEVRSRELRQLRIAAECSWSAADDTVTVTLKTRDLDWLIRAGRNYQGTTAPEFSGRFG